jgi:hypothetical protein
MDWLTRLSPSSSCTCLGEITAHGYEVIVQDPCCVYHGSHDGQG